MASKRCIVYLPYQRMSRVKLQRFLWGLGPWRAIDDTFGRLEINDHDFGLPSVEILQ